VKASYMEQVHNMWSTLKTLATTTRWCRAFIK